MIFYFIFIILLVVPFAIAAWPTTSLSLLRGGAIRNPSNSDMADYYEKFHIDYGVDDNRRMAGALRGFIKTGTLANLPQSDAFLEWLQTYMEEGAVSAKGRLKAYHAADFGVRSNLRQGENPKLIIVNRKLQSDSDGYLTSPPSREVDVEVREIWQPWLKSKCNFAVRYIVPDRVNIIKILQSQRRFSSELIIDSVVDQKSGKETKTGHIAMTFKPTLWQRLQGKRNVIMKCPVDASKLIR